MCAAAAAAAAFPWARGPQRSPSVIYGLHALLSVKRTPAAPFAKATFVASFRRRRSRQAGRHEGARARPLASQHDSTRVERMQLNCTQWRLPRTHCHRDSVTFAPASKPTNQPSSLALASSFYVL